MKQLLLKNSVVGVAQSFINLILLIIAVPIFIKVLGKESYGIFSLVMVVGNLNIFTNLGLNQALLKFLSEQGKGQESDHDIIVSIFLLLLILLPIISLGIFFRQFLLIHLLGLSPTTATSAQWLLVWTLLANLLIMLGQVPKTMLESIQKIYITNWLQTIYSFLYWIFVIVAVARKRHLDYVGIATFSSALIWFIMTWISALRQWNAPTYRNLSCNIARTAKKQLSYGIKIYIGSLTSFFFEPLTKIIISHWFGVTEVGYFDIALRIKAQIQTVMLKLFAPLMPLLAQWGNSDKTRYLIQDLEKKSLLLTIPLGVTLFFTLSPALNLWLGEHSRLIDICVKIIAISFLIFSTTAMPSYLFFLACGFPQNTTYIQLTNTGVNLLCLLALQQSAGFLAVPISSAVAIFCSFLLGIYMQKRISGFFLFFNYSLLTKVITNLILLLLFGFLTSLIFTHNITSILATISAISFITVIHYSTCKAITHKDIQYYFGESCASTILTKLFKTTL